MNNLVSGVHRNMYRLCNCHLCVFIWILFFFKALFLSGVQLLFNGQINRETSLYTSFQAWPCPFSNVVLKCFHTALVGNSFPEIAEDWMPWRQCFVFWLHFRWMQLPRERTSQSGPHCCLCLFTVTAVT